MLAEAGDSALSLESFAVWERGFLVPVIPVWVVNVLPHAESELSVQV